MIPERALHSGRLLVRSEDMGPPVAIRLESGQAGLVARVPTNDTSKAKASLAVGAIGQPPTMDFGLLLPGLGWGVSAYPRFPGTPEESLSLIHERLRGLQENAMAGGLILRPFVLPALRVGPVCRRSASG